MIKSMWVKLFFCLVLKGTVQCCPTCVGRVTYDSPPFFSEEFYNIYMKSVIDQHNNIQQHVKLSAKYEEKIHEIP